MAQQYYLNIFSDLMETDPLDPFIMPDPYDQTQDVQTNIESLYCLIRWSITINDRTSALIHAYYLGNIFEKRLPTPALRNQYRHVLSRHYREACTRVYNLYRIVGIQQIYRTKRTSFWMFRKIKRTTYAQLLQDAISLM
jgi:hypothetical protein